jgi:hypothetical protein
VPTETATPLPTATEPAGDATPIASPVETAAPTETAVASPDPEPVLPVAEQFETDLSAWSNQGASLAAGEGRDGSQALLLASSGDAVTSGQPSFVQREFGVEVPSIYVSFDFKAPVLDQIGMRLATIAGADGSAIAAVYLLPNGALGVRIGGEDTLRVLATIDPLTWNHLELATRVSAGTTVVSLWVDGVAAGEVVGDPGGTSARSLALGGWATDRTWQLLIDNVRIDRSCTGSCPSTAPLEPTSVPGDIAPATPVSG